MKVIFNGLGSIGRRHLTNLSELCRELDLPLEIHALRSTDKPLIEDVGTMIDKEVYDLAVLDSQYDIAFITNPTGQHYKAIMNLLGRCKHMFIEKPLFDSTNYSIEDMPWRAGGIYYVAAPLRYTGVVQALEQIVKEESIYNIRVICSSYLPDWREGVDYRTVYSAKNNEGGGVRTDLIHEWDYITHLFGFPEQVYSLSGTFSELEIDSEDIAVYIAAYKDKLIEVHLDYFGRVPQRKIELYTRDGLITGDFLTNRIHYSDNRGTIDLSTSSTSMYVAEMRHFLELILNSPGQPSAEHTVPKPLAYVHHAYEVLKLSTGRQQG